MIFCLDAASRRSLGRSADSDGGAGDMIAVPRQVWFWLATAVAIVLALWLLHGILLPFVAGTALAYLLDPFANRLERLGLTRAIADAGPKLGSS
jgi:hypothetical protein